MPVRSPGTAGCARTRVKSGMSGERRPVADVAVSAAGNNCQNERGVDCSFTDSFSTSPARRRGMASQAAARRPRAGAARTRPRALIPSRPSMIGTPGRPEHPEGDRDSGGDPGPGGHTAAISVPSARPPIQVWMPNQPHATSARRIAGRSRRARRTGAAQHRKRDAVFVPACAFRIIGTSTMRLPSRMVASPATTSCPAASAPTRACRS